LIGGLAADSGARADQSGLEMMLSRLSEVELEQMYHDRLRVPFWCAA
jgi:hypothetical protein